MGAHLVSRMAAQRPTALAMEAHLLNLFTVTPASHAQETAASRSEHAILWRADAAHRIKNLSQMALALATLADRPSAFLPAEAIARARSLARAYSALGDDEGGNTPVPCASLLTEVVLGLVNVFGSTRGISARVTAEATLLAPASRRALILIASELTINALKYGFPGATGGTISVNLSRLGQGFYLTVEDDGAGNLSYVAGHGSGLIEGLAAILSATVTRSASPNERGFRVAVWAGRGDAAI
jgi:two-component sensor histidine kinase